MKQRIKHCTRDRLAILATVVLLLSMPVGSHGAQQPDVFVLQGVEFVDNTAVLEQGSDGGLEDLARQLLSESTLTIEIHCHVSASANPRQDAKLSRERAETLRRWLISRGVAFYRLQVPRSIMSTSASEAAGGERIEIVRIHKSFPVADIAERVFRFEPVADGREVLHDFTVRNKGDAPLAISKVRTG